MTENKPTSDSVVDNAAFAAMADRLLTRGHATSWLNHWSLLHADFGALARMNTIGFDGTFLQMRLRAAGHAVARTSTDLVLPYVFDRLDQGTRITLIGTTVEAGQAAAAPAALRCSDDRRLRGVASPQGRSWDSTRV